MDATASWRESRQAADPVRDPVRLRALERSRLLDPGSAVSLDAVARVAARLTDAPVAIACLIAADRQVVIGRHGLGRTTRSLRRRPLARSLCEQVVRTGEPVLVGDARRERKSAAREPELLAYAGVPLRDGEGQVLGALCVMAPGARDWTNEASSLLAELATVAVSEVRREAATAEADRCRRALDQAESIARVGSWRWDPEADELECSTELCRLLGLERNPRTRAEFDAIAPPDLRAELVAAVRGGLRPDGSWQAEHAISLTEGWRLLISRGQSRMTADGTLHLIRGVVQDVTEQRDLEERLQAITAAAPIGVARLGLIGSERGRWLECNRELERMLGAARGELTGRELDDLTHPDDLEHSMRVLARLARGEAESAQHELRLLGAGDAWVPVLASHSLLRGPDGQPSYAIGQYLDIAERRRRDVEREWLAERDELTGVFNRRHFELELRRALSRAERAGSSGALLRVELDGLSALTGSGRKDAADVLILRVAHSLSAMLREGDTLGRLAAEEFAILLPDADLSQARRVAERLLRAVRRRTDAEAAANDLPPVTASIGITSWLHGRPAAGASILEEADTALYEAKRAGGDAYVVYDVDAGEPASTL